MKLRSQCAAVACYPLPAVPRSMRRAGRVRDQRRAAGLWREPFTAGKRPSNRSVVRRGNDLAIAYEHEGQLDKARKAYEKALELEPNNLQIRQNFELFKEINDRTSPGKDTTSQ
jgi:tetratricopeptide (TPR) repeat protein